MQIECNLETVIWSKLVLFCMLTLTDDTVPLFDTTAEFN